MPDFGNTPTQSSPVYGTDIFTNAKPHRNVAGEVLNMFFATDSLSRLAKGQGSWGDALNVGITAATFFIPPLKLAGLSEAMLVKVAEKAAETATSDIASAAAKKAAERTYSSAVEAIRSPKYMDYIRNNIAMDKKFGKLPEKEWPMPATTSKTVAEVEPGAIERSTSTTPKSVPNEPEVRDWETGGIVKPEDTVDFKDSLVGKYYSEAEATKREQITILEKQIETIAEKDGASAVPSHMKVELDSLKKSLEYKAPKPETIERKMNKKSREAFLKLPLEMQIDIANGIKSLPGFDKAGLVEKPKEFYEQVRYIDPITGIESWISKSSAEEFARKAIPRFAKTGNKVVDSTAYLVSRISVLQRKLGVKNLSEEDRVKTKELFDIAVAARKSAMDSLSVVDRLKVETIAEEIDLRMKAAKAVTTGKPSMSSLTIKQAESLLSEMQAFLGKMKESPLNSTKRINDFKSVGRQLRENINALTNRRNS